MILQNAMNSIIRKGGRTISIKYYLQTTGSIYDEAISLNQSGNTIWTSGVLFTLDPNSSQDKILLEQGKIGIGDIKLYTNPIFYDFAGSTLQTKIGIGSPSSEYYSLIPVGANAQEMAGTDIYKLAYLRKLQTGSFIGE